MGIGIGFGSATSGQLLSGFGPSVHLQVAHQRLPDRMQVIKDDLQNEYEIEAAQDHRHNSEEVIHPMTLSLTTWFTTLCWVIAIVLALLWM